MSTFFVWQTNNFGPINCGISRVAIEIKNENEKLLMRLNPRCPELRGAANPHQARYHCLFAVPIRRSSMPGHRGFRLAKLGRNIKSSFFSEMTVKT